MAWPNATDYHEAIQNLGVSAGDEELRAGQLTTNSLGLPMLWSGNFADVYKIYCPATDTAWALKCFTREVPGLRERYREIAAHLDGAGLPFTVDFQYLQQGIRVGGQWFPALKMRWVEGLTLNRFVEEHVKRPRMLRQLLDLWVKMADRLRDAEVAHADLQHGNVLLVPMSRGQLALRLIDYDGMHVPALAGTRSGELGHPAFQHPQRIQQGTYNAEVDRFSHLAIFCAVRCLTVGRKRLWQQFNNEDNLLFRESDFRSPGTSEVFHTLWRLRDPNCRALVGHLAVACRKPLEEAPLLTELIDNGNVLPLSRQEETAVEVMLADEKSARKPPVRTVTDAADTDKGATWFVSESGEVFPELPPVRAVTDAADTDKGSPWWVSKSAQPGDTLPPPLPDGTAPASPAAMPMPSVEPAGRGEKLRDVGLAIFRTAVWPFRSAVRGFDRVLAAVAGMHNVILHNFLRVLTAVCAIVGVVLLGALMVKEGSSPHVRPPPLPEITLDVGDGVKMELVLIPAGSFIMGDDYGPTYEKPAHKVTISQPFYLSKYEVTQQQWEALMGNNPSEFKGPTNPVEEVDWNDCQQFLAKLNKRFANSGATYSLPTEAQWEYACRADTTTEYSFADDESSLGEYAWYSGNSNETTHQVGQKKPNGWGLYDMYGNVWEWCSDWYADYDDTKPVSDPSGPTSGSGRVLRGGSFGIQARNLRSASRFASLPGSPYGGCGFRLARTLTGTPSPASSQTLRLEPIAPQSIEVGKQLTLAVSVEDAASWAGKLRYSFGPQAPSGANIDAQTGMLTWTPLQQQRSGDYDVTVVVREPGGQQDQTTFTITFTRPPSPWKEIPVDLGGGVTMELVLIPAGSFTMGDDNGGPNEKPAHEVRISQPFYLGKYEVTQRQWEALMGNNPSEFRGPANPVEQVSWIDCRQFLAKLNEKFANSRATYSLPTEAQWEYACRAGTTTQYSFGDDENSLAEYAWYLGNSNSTTHQVGQKKPNSWGLYDMHGNVWEWCADWYAEYDDTEPVSDPSGPSSGFSRALRGGSFVNQARDLRSAGRYNYLPGDRVNSIGFRLARTYR